MKHPIVFVLACLLLACAPTRQPRGAAEPSGFLGDYSKLEKGPEGGAKLLYVNPKAELSRYGDVQLDSVTMWNTRELAKLPRDVQEQLVARLYKSLHDALEKDYRIVDTPGPGVMRVRAALTEAEPSNVPLDVVATFLPQARMLGGVVGLSADSALTVGKAAVEVEITDALSGTRLVAAVDERVGARSASGVTNKWSDVQEAFDYWAERLRSRLQELRSGTAAK
jgi:hypothetical protein